jgi:hypothetical protein
VALIKLASGVSVTLQLKLLPFMSAGTPLQLTLDRPENASDAVPLTLIGEAKTFAPVTGEITATLGAVLSSFIVTDTEAVFPALSMAVPTTIWPPVSEEMTIGSLQKAIPLSLSAHVNVTVGSLLFHPAAFGAGDTLAVIVGGTASVTIFAANLEVRFAASKYRRRPTALLWPPQLAPEALVPIRVSIFTNSTSFVPLNEVCENGAIGTATSFALLAFLVTPVTQRVRPEDTRVAFLYTST